MAYMGFSSVKEINLPMIENKPVSVTWISNWSMFLKILDQTLKSQPNSLWTLIFWKVYQTDHK